MSTSNKVQKFVTSSENAQFICFECEVDVNIYSESLDERETLGVLFFVSHHQTEEKFRQRLIMALKSKISSGFCKMDAPKYWQIVDIKGPSCLWFFKTFDITGNIIFLESLGIYSISNLNRFKKFVCYYNFISTFCSFYAVIS